MSLLLRGGVMVKIDDCSGTTNPLVALRKCWVHVVQSLVCMLWTVDHQLTPV